MGKRAMLSTVKNMLTKKNKRGIAKVAIKIYVKQNEMVKNRKEKKLRHKCNYSKP